jgi:hypothetical protein
MANKHIWVFLSNFKNRTLRHLCHSFNKLENKHIRLPRLQCPHTLCFIFYEEKKIWMQSQRYLLFIAL